MNWIEGFLSDCNARGLTSHTVETYKSCVSDFLRGYPDPLEVSLDDLQTYLGDLRARELQGSTLKGYFAALASLYDFLVFKGVMTASPIPSFRKRYLRIKTQYNGENRRQLISIAQMSRLINLAGKDILDRTIMLFLAKTGLRRGELIAMDLNDIDLEKMEFRIKPKAKRSNRLGFLDSELTGALHEYLDWREQKTKDKALWVAEHGRRVSRNYVYNTVVSYAKLVGLHDPDGPLCKRFGPHNFRHFFTTWLRRNGMQREFIQEMRGDRHGDAVDIYDHIDVEELRCSYLECVPQFGTGAGRIGTLDEWCKEKGSV